MSKREQNGGEPACRRDGHPGKGKTVSQCERDVRKLERAGGAGQWLAQVRAEHKDQKHKGGT